MRPIVCQAWRDAIDESVEARFPRFKPFGGRVRGEPRGMKKYQWQPFDGLWCYVAFRPLDSEGFEAYVGWSTKDKFPIGSGNELSQPRDVWNFDAPFVLAFSMELVPRHGCSYWMFWNPPSQLFDDPAAFGKAYGLHFSRDLTYEEARLEVAPAVSMGIAEVNDFGIPYLEKRIAHKREFVAAPKSQP